MLEVVDEYGWHEVESREKLFEIIERLKAFESMTWGEIIKNDTTGSHFIEGYRLTDRDAKKKLESLKVSLDTFVCSLRHHKRERIWGIREGSALKLLWWDPEHLIYECDR